MNRSGIAVLETANFYKILPENILVFHANWTIGTSNKIKLINKIKNKIGLP